MKKIFTILMIASIFSLVACGPSAEEQAAADAKAAALVEDLVGDMEEQMEDVADEKPAHECDTKCEEEGCTGARCGEAGHECTDACHAETDGEHTCDANCNSGTHKCGGHCGCGEGCGCSEGATCSAKCDIKKEEDTEE